VATLPGEDPGVSFLGRAQRLLENELAYRHARPQHDVRRSMVDNLELKLTLEAGMNCGGRYVNPDAQPRQRTLALDTRG